MPLATRMYERHRRVLEYSLLVQTLELPGNGFTKRAKRRLKALLKNQRTNFGSEQLRWTDDLKRRNGIAEVMKARTAAGVEAPGEEHGWIRRAKRKFREWSRDEIKDRAWMLSELEYRVGHEFPMIIPAAHMDTRKSNQRKLYHQVSEVDHGGIPEEHCLGLVRLLALTQREPQLLMAQFAASCYADACRHGDDRGQQLWLFKIAEAGYDILNLAPDDDGIIQPPSEDEDEGEVLLVGTWELCEEDEVEEQGTAGPSSGGGDKRILPEPISDLEEMETTT